MLGTSPDVSAAALLSLQQMEARVSSTVLRISGNVDETPERPGQPASAGRGEPASGTGTPRNLRKLSIVFCTSVSALEWIHRRQLWTQEFHSFSQYARERWQITRQRLYQIIKCKTVLDVCARAEAHTKILTWARTPNDGNPTRIAPTRQRPSFNQ